MQPEVSSFEKPCLPFGFSACLFLGLLPILPFAACAPNAAAQMAEMDTSRGEISGTVLLASSKRPASQVAVSLRSRVMGIFRSVLTDVEGHFKVQNLPQGEYEVAVEEEGFEAARASTQLDGSSSTLVLYLKSKTSAIPTNNYTVSVRELKIPGKARSELEKGMDRMAKNDAAGSLSHFEKAAQIFPGYFEAYYNIGAAEMALGHDGEAASAFQTSIDLSGGQFTRAQFGLAYLFCQEGRAAEAEKIVRRALEIDDAAEGYVILSEVLTHLARPDEAEKSAREALLRNPAYAGAYLALSDAAAFRGDYRAEIEAFDAFLKLQPNSPDSAQVRRFREEALKKLTALQAAR